MPAITGLTCIYDVVRQQWAAELKLEGTMEPKRFSLRGPEHAETRIEALEDATSALFDAEMDEVRFVYELVGEDESGEDDEESPEDDEEDDEDEDEDADDTRRLAS
jgi:hypothetical protein